MALKYHVASGRARELSRENAGMFAAAIKIAKTAFAELPEDLLQSSAPAAVDVFVLLDPDADWKRAQVSLDFLGTHLSDRPPFGGMALSPPMESARRSCSPSRSRCRRPRVTDSFPTSASQWKR